jgi:hypothetical protein
MLICILLFLCLVLTLASGLLSFYLIHLCFSFRPCTPFVQSSGVIGFEYLGERLFGFSVGVGTVFFAKKRGCSFVFNSL